MAVQILEQGTRCDGFYAIVSIDGAPRQLFHADVQPENVQAWVDGLAADIAAQLTAQEIAANLLEVQGG